VGGLTGRALLVLPPSGFHDEEYFQTKRALELAGMQVAVASTRMERITGMLGGTAQANVLLRQASADDYDAVIFIGGLGAASYFNDPAALNLARRAATQRKVLAAIGTAPSILAGANVLRSVRSTAYISEQNRLTLAGAIYTGNPAEKDGLIITATGPLAVALFTQAILDGLSELGRP
jgi:protease I